MQILQEYTPKWKVWQLNITRSTAGNEGGGGGVVIPSVIVPIIAGAVILIVACIRYRHSISRTGNAVFHPNHQTTDDAHRFQPPRARNDPAYNIQRPTVHVGNAAVESPPTYQESFIAAEPPSYLEVQENGDLYFDASVPPSYPGSPRPPSPPNAEHCDT